MEIFVSQNNRLLDLTNRMYHRTAQMYRMSLANMSMYLDGEDCDVEGKLVYSYNDSNSVLKYEEDRIYQSDQSVFAMRCMIFVPIRIIPYRICCEWMISS